MSKQLHKSIQSKSLPQVDYSQPEYWPRSTWVELSRPYSELLAEAKVRRVVQFLSEYKVVYFRPSQEIAELQEALASIYHEVIQPIVEVPRIKLPVCSRFTAPLVDTLVFDRRPEQEKGVVA